MMKRSVCGRIVRLVENNCYEKDACVRPEAEALVAALYRVMSISPLYPGKAWHYALEGVEVYRAARFSRGRAQAPAVTAGEVHEIWPNL